MIKLYNNDRIEILTKCAPTTYPHFEDSTSQQRPKFRLVILYWTCTILMMITDNIVEFHSGLTNESKNTVFAGYYTTGRGSEKTDHLSCVGTHTVQVRCMGCENRYNNILLYSHGNNIYKVPSDAMSTRLYIIII